jgi:hypothetical protein
MHVKISDILPLQWRNFELKFVFSSDPRTGDNFTCICMEGFEGPNCNKPYCLEQLCHNGGSCDLTRAVSQMRHLPNHKVTVLLVSIKKVLWLYGGV